MAKKRKFTDKLRFKTLEELEAWERERGPDIKPWKLDIVQQVKKEKRKIWFAHHRDQIISAVISGAFGAVVGGLIVAWITLGWKP